MEEYKSNVVAKSYSVSSGPRYEPVGEEGPHDDTTSENIQATFWVPLFLSRPVLLAFVTLFSLCAISLGILLAFSQRNSGFADADAGSYYLWTYGPTAFFTLLAVLWSQTEYRAKQLQPWINMRSGFRPAEETVLLDYISDWNVIVLFRALRRRHFLAALGISGSLLLRLMVVFSTSLFVLEYATLTDNHAPVQITEEFGLPDFPSLTQITTGFDLRPVAAVVAFAKQSLAPAPGATATQAYQNFQPLDQSPNALGSTQLTVDVFESSLDCEPATMTLDFHLRNDTLADNYQFSASSASCGNATLPLNRQMFGNVLGLFAQTVNCSTTSQDLNEEENRFLIAVGKSPARNSTSIAKLANMTAFICSATYRIFPAPVETWPSFGAIISPSDDEPNSRMLDNLQPRDLLQAFSQAVNDASTSLSSLFDQVSTPTLNWKIHNPFWALMFVTHPVSSPVVFQNPTILLFTLQTVWSTWSAQTAALHFKVSANETAIGKVEVMRSRLYIHGLAFWIEECLLVVLIAVNLGILFLRVRGVSPRDPTSLAGMAVILLESPGLQSALDGWWRHPPARMQHRLAKYNFCSKIEEPPSVDGHWRFLIGRQDAAGEPESKASSECHEDRDTSQKWWRPSAYTNRYIRCTLLALVSIVVALESLYLESSNHNGLANVSDPQGVEHFAWTTLPAVIMMGLAILVEKLHFNVQLLFPYQAICHQSVKADQGLFRYPFVSSHLTSFRTLLHRGESMIIATTFSVFLAAFLTTVVSGLYTPAESFSSFDVDVHQQDRFDPNFVYVASNNISIMLDLVALSNIPFPQWTYKTIAFPTMIPSNATTLSGSDTLSVQVSALQASLNCSIVQTEGAVLTNEVLVEQKPAVAANITVRDPSPCMQQVVTSPGTSEDGLASFQVVFQEDTMPGYSPPPPEKGYFGYLGPIPGAQTGCPGTVGIVGQTRNNQVVNQTLFTCDPVLKEVAVNATFYFPSMYIYPYSPPRVVAELANDPANLSAIAWNETLNDGLIMAMESSSPINALPFLDTTNVSGSFLGALVYGRDGVPASDLVGQANEARLLSQVDLTWGITAAQLLNEHRAPLNGPGFTVQGQVSGSDGYRLMQSQISTQLLVSMSIVILATMRLVFLGRGKLKSLPFNPNSIAGLASLVVGSKLLSGSLLPKGAEWLPDEALIRHLDDLHFSLRSWPDPEGGDSERYGVGIVAHQYPD